MEFGLLTAGLLTAGQQAFTPLIAESGHQGGPIMMAVLLAIGVVGAVAYGLFRRVERTRAERQASDRGSGVDRRPEV
jgi:hypothetical protein